MTILHIDASINGENSASRAISKSIVDQVKGANWGQEVIYRDLAANPLPHLTLDSFADTSVVDEFLGADIIVIGAPMYNFTIPSHSRHGSTASRSPERLSATRKTDRRAWLGEDA